MLIGSILAPSKEAIAEALNVSDDRQQSAVNEEANSLKIAESQKSRAAQPTAAAQKNFYQIGELSGIHGASVSTTFRWYRDIDNLDIAPDFLRWVLEEKASLWTSFRLNNLQGYVRGSMSNTDRGTGPTYTGIGADVEGPALELAFVTADFMQSNNWPLRLTTGRQVQYVGRGLSYYSISDGVQLQVTDTTWPQKYFIAHSLPRADNIDFSVPGYDKEGNRLFYGGEWGYNGIPRISLYAYTFGQVDDGGENPDDRRQSYDYNSFYYGGGFAARPTTALQIWGEVVGETGSGYTDGGRSIVKQTQVSAWAWILGVKQQLELFWHPTIEAEGAYGSGDPDRIVVNTTVNGTTDIKDTNFLYFGYYAGGYALQPRLSNLYIMSAGLNLQPLESIPAFKKFALGSKAYVYFKDERDGGTSSYQSVNRNSDVGTEWDAYIHWQVMDNLLWSIRYGIFLPGHAFLADQSDPTQFLYTRISIDF
jgi:hypothetical protein